MDGEEKEQEQQALAVPRDSNKEPVPSDVQPMRQLALRHGMLLQCQSIKAQAVGNVSGKQ